ncbi:uncharacterized protein [Oryza sativa Japonica Group]|uniref:uncharacterized protein n=1 Tax=Oryza sativa subsp. japonica TaxID=39947 RepID=UPI0001C7EB19|nr:uncharacterized protein LOC4326490 isoform X2 [Oryza sativa Japonica Group]KAF2950008.1 hypothetical protein DAI22_01g160100 [Oryza sativa Japonica Group]
MSSTSMSVRSPASFPFPTAAGARGRVGSAQPVGPKLLSSPLPPAATPAVPRRLLFPVAAGIWDFLSGGGAGGAAAASLAVRGGMQLFRQGDVAGSVAEFDRAIELDQRQKKYLWQRGLSLYYLDRFEEGAEQFRLDVAANPNDTEESIWCFLCEAQLYGVDEARKRFLEVGLDSRSVMREAYALFKDGGDPEKLASNFSSGSEGEIFYSSLYTGLYYESQKDAELAKSHIVAACRSPYGSRSGDYMASLALVHCQCRNWTLE